MKQTEYSAPAVAKVIDIFELMAARNKSMTVTEISQSLNITVNSTFRILKELETKKYVQKDTTNSSYMLTGKLYYLGSSIGDRITLKTTAFESMNLLAEITRETAILTTFSHKYKTLIVDQVESPEPLKFVSTIGFDYTSHSSAMGKAMLAYVDENRLNDFFKLTAFDVYTNHTITDQDRFRAELENIRGKGYSLDDEETCIGLKCIGVPIFDVNGEVAGAIGISGPVFRVEKSFVRFVEAVKQSGVSISELLGFKEEKCAQYDEVNKVI